MKLSQLAINSVSTRQSSVEEALAAYSAAGFRNVEFVIPQIKQFLAEGHSLDDLARLLDRYGLRCIGGFETVLEAFSPPEQRATNHTLVVENARLLGALGGTALVVGTDGPPNPGAVPDVLGVLAETFAHVAAQILDTGVTLCIEFNWSPVVKSVRTAVEIARRSGAPNVGVLFDAAHYHCTPSKFEHLTAESVPFIRHVHVDDMRDKPGELSDCNSDRVLPGQGCLDLRALFGQLDRHGYSGYYSIELFNDELWAMPAAEAARLMYKSLLPYCEDAV
ncbi:MAG: sugar phosphate isomerase/epimerase [Armatimonadetes bacterium]|nr:sugar phosphate isomerase/epimerase [Armatimonadota bacterium]